MHKKLISEWEPHNLLSFIEDNEIDRFTTKSVVNMYSDDNYFNGYYEKCVEKMCSKLLKNGYLTASYFSDGRKTVTEYKYIKREFKNG